MNRFLVALFLVGLFFVGCRFDKTDKRNEVEQTYTEEDLINMHKSMNHAEDVLIAKYLETETQVYNVTGTGLRYFIYNTTKGELITENKTVTLKYSNKVLLKDSLDNKPRTISFQVGHSSQIPTGIDEGIRLMKKGEKAKFVLPPHLGYGVSGNQESSIPPKAILIYDIEIVEVTN